MGGDCFEGKNGEAYIGFLEFQIPDSQKREQWDKTMRSLNKGNNRKNESWENNEDDSNRDRVGDLIVVPNLENNDTLYQQILSAI